MEYLRILCGLTGDVLNEDNVPYIFPSGHVYGLRALESLREVGKIWKIGLENTQVNDLLKKRR